MAVFVFVTASAILLLNLLIAQLNCTYVLIFQNNIGFARLKRAGTIVETLAVCPAVNWRRFVDSLRLDTPLEFNEGDVGMSGGIQTWEPANSHLVTTDAILRFGGSYDPSLPWPEDTSAEDDEDRVERLGRLMQRTMQKLNREKGSKGRSGRLSSSGSSAEDGSGS